MVHNGGQLNAQNKFFLGLQFCSWQFIAPGLSGSDFGKSRPSFDQIKDVPGNFFLKGEHLL